VPYMRPEDYFAEMVKDDKHMARVRRALLEQKQRIEAVESRKRSRDLKKYGKQVQAEKQQKAAKQKAAEQEKIKQWKGRLDTRLDDNDEFPIALEEDDASKIADRPQLKRYALPAGLVAIARSSKLTRACAVDTVEAVALVVAPSPAVVLLSRCSARSVSTRCVVCLAVLFSCELTLADIATLVLVVVDAIDRNHDRTKSTASADPRRCRRRTHARASTTSRPSARDATRPSIVICITWWSARTRTSCVALTNPTPIDRASSDARRCAARPSAASDRLRELIYNTRMHQVRLDHRSH